MLNTRVVALSVQLALALTLLVVPASAAPAADGSIVSPACASQTASHPLGVDGGLTALSRGEISLQAASVASSVPLGVDGGLLGLMFARSQQPQVVASIANTCAGAFLPSGS